MSMVKQVFKLRLIHFYLIYLVLTRVRKKIR